MIAVWAGVLSMTKREVGGAMRECFKLWLTTYKTIPKGSASESEIGAEVLKLIQANKDEIVPWDDYSDHSNSFGYRYRKNEHDQLRIPTDRFDDLKEKYRTQPLHEALLDGGLVIPSRQGVAYQQRSTPGRQGQVTFYLFRPEMVLNV